MAEIPINLQLIEVRRRIGEYTKKGLVLTEYLSLLFLKYFPGLMDDMVSWDSITSLFKRIGVLPIKLIDSDILNDWCACPSVWEGDKKDQHPQHAHDEGDSRPEQGQEAWEGVGMCFFLHSCPAGLSVNDEGVRTVGQIQE